MSTEATRTVNKEQLLNLLLLHIPLKECAVRLNLSYQTIRTYSSDPTFLGMLQQLSQAVYAEVVQDLKYEHKTLHQKMLEASDRALDKLAALLDSAQEGIALKAADSILDRTAETARNRRVESDITGRFTLDPVMLMHAAMTAQEIEPLKQESKQLPPHEEPETIQ